MPSARRLARGSPVSSSPPRPNGERTRTSQWWAESVPRVRTRMESRAMMILRHAARCPPLRRALQQAAIPSRPGLTRRRAHRVITPPRAAETTCATTQPLPPRATATMPCCSRWLPEARCRACPCPRAPCPTAWPPRTPWTTMLRCRTRPGTLRMPVARPTCPHLLGERLGQGWMPAPCCAFNEKQGSRYSVNLSNHIATRCCYAC
mmetsp:Transcript_34926/g.90691  ORF Transcript_34926/g.90691 Transcript_34926/m.90691 type:complete len:206 (-) Transcript_34926:60-677(-)